VKDFISMIEALKSEVKFWIEFFQENLCLTACTFAFILYLIGVNEYRNRVEFPKAYSTWCRHTGNPAGITLEEWTQMVRVGGSTTVIPVAIAK